MNSVWLSLLWKEWREQRWKLAALTGISVGTPFAIIAILFYAHEVDIAEATLGISTSFLFAYALLAGMFVGMSVAASENSHRTVRFMRAWPVPTWKAALAKVTVAMIVIALPVVISMACVWICMFFQPPELVELAALDNIRDFNLPWRIENIYVARTMAGVFGTWSVFLWAIAGGVNRVDEVRAGAISFLVGAGVWLIFAFGVGIAERCAGTALTDRAFLLFGALPGGPGFVTRNSVMGSTTNHIVFSVVGLGSHAVVLTWFLRQFGRVPMSPKRDAARNWDFAFWRTTNSLPFGTSFGAIIWKQVREIGPLALLAVVSICAIAPLVYWIDRMDGGIGRFGDILGSITIAVATLVVLVIGIGLFYEDYMKGVESFWRSRPINLHLWFWAKYLAGIIVQLLAFLPLLAISYWEWSENTFLAGCYMVLIYLLLYSLALAFYALVRQPIYAVILTIAAITIGWMSLVLVSPGGPPRWLNSFLGVSFALLLPVVLASLLAWQAVVRDWGWKQHR